MLNRDLLKWVLLSYFLAMPLAWLGMRRWLEAFACKTAQSWWIFVLAGIIAFLLSAIPPDFPEPERSEPRRMFAPGFSQPGFPGLILRRSHFWDHFLSYLSILSGSRSFFSLDYSEFTHVFHHTEC